MLLTCISSHYFLSLFVRSPPSGAHYVCDSVLSAVQMLSTPPFTSTVEKILVLGGTDVYKVNSCTACSCDSIYTVPLRLGSVYN